MKLYNIPNARRFMEKILECTGRIYKREADGSAQDMREMAQYLINSGMADQITGIQEIDLVIESVDDMVILLNYAAGMHYERRAA